MQRRSFSLLALGSVLAGCASTEQKNFRAAISSRNSVFLDMPAWQVQMPYEYAHRKPFTNELEKSYSTQEMAAWMAFFLQYYTAENVQNRFNLVVKDTISSRGFEFSGNVVGPVAENHEIKSNEICIKFTELKFSGIAFGIDRGKRMILTVSGRRGIRAGNESWGDLYNTHISPALKSESKGIIRPSEIDQGRELAQQRLDEALGRWTAWALAPLRK